MIKIKTYVYFEMRYTFSWWLESYSLWGWEERVENWLKNLQKREEAAAFEFNQALRFLILLLLSPPLLHPLCLS